MAATIIEHVSSRSQTIGAAPSAELIYKIWNTEDEAEVKAKLLATAPASYLGLQIGDWTIEPDGQVWTATVPYVDKSINDKFSLSLAGGTAHISTALEHIAEYGPGPNPPPGFAGAIGVNGDTVEGVDIGIRAFAFTITRYLSNAAIDAFVDDMYTKSWNSNSAVVSLAVDGLAMTFQIGELIYKDGSAVPRENADDWEIILNFAAEPNTTTLSVAGIGPIIKKGWEYLWVRHVDDEDQDAKQLVRKPDSVHIEKVYEAADLNTLLS